MKNLLDYIKVLIIISFAIVVAFFLVPAGFECKNIPSIWRNMPNVTFWCGPIPEPKKPTVPQTPQQPKIPLIEEFVNKNSGAFFVKTKTKT